MWQSVAWYKQVLYSSMRSRDAFGSQLVDHRSLLSFKTYENKFDKHHISMQQNIQAKLCGDIVDQTWTRWLINYAELSWTDHVTRTCGIKKFQQCNVSTNLNVLCSDIEP